MVGQTRPNLSRRPPGEWVACGITDSRTEAARSTGGSTHGAAGASPRSPPVRRESEHTPRRTPSHLTASSLHGESNVSGPVGFGARRPLRPGLDACVSRREAPTDRAGSLSAVAATPGSTSSGCRRMVSANVGLMLVTLPVTACRPVLTELGGGEAFVLLPSVLATGVDHALYYWPSVGATALLLLLDCGHLHPSVQAGRARTDLERLTCQTQGPRRPPINSHNHPKGG